MEPGGRGADLSRPPRKRRFAVLDCEDREKWTGHERYWIEPLRRDGQDWRSYRVWAGEMPADLDSLDGAVVTGSHHSVLDDSLPWLEPLLSFLRAAAGGPSGPRVVGACFGAQALALAFGGRVGANPQGRFVFGAEQIALRPGFAARFAADDGAPGASISLLESHAECVLELPPGADLLGQSGSAANEIFALGGRALALQGHPELPRQAMVEKILPGLRESGRLDADGEAAALRSMERELDDRLVMGLIGRFLDGTGDPGPA